MKAVLSLLCFVLPLNLMAAKVSSDKAESKDEVKSYFKTLNSKMKSGETVESDQMLPEEAAELKESDIPLGLKQKKSKSKSSITPFQRMVFSLGVLLVFSFGALIWVQRRGKKGPTASGARNIKILSRKNIGPKKELMIIRIAGETILLGVTDANINPIKSLSLLDDEVPQFTDQNFSKELSDKISTDFYEEPPRERVNGYEVSRLSEVQDAISQRYS